MLVVVGWCVKTALMGSAESESLVVAIVETRISRSEDHRFSQAFERILTLLY